MQMASSPAGNLPDGEVAARISNTAAAVLIVRMRQGSPSRCDRRRWDNRVKAERI
jgi:hypothetical protein